MNRMPCHEHKPNQQQINEDLGNRLLEWHGGMSSGLYSVGSMLLENFEPQIDEVIRAINELRNLKRHANFPEALDIEDELQASELSNELEDKYKVQILQYQSQDIGISSMLTPRRQA